MIKTSRQLKDLINNLAKEKSADSQMLIRYYMMERFLERVSLSQYKYKFILKGGMLVAALIGLDKRSTMDIDVTIKGIDLNNKEIEKMINDIIMIQIDDGVTFKIKNISIIMDEAEYPGIRISMDTYIDKTITPLKIDISTDDTITPKEVQYSYKLILENRNIDILAYNLETVLAEKLETIISRSVFNTRMRDFYDVFIIFQLHADLLDQSVINEALLATAIKRGTVQNLDNALKIINDVESNLEIKRLWKNYQEKFSYASKIDWTSVMLIVRKLLVFKK